MRCPSCGCSDININDSGGESICTNCGRVLEENTIVSSIEFSENASGSSSVIGQFVSATSTKPYGAGAGPGHGFSKESREVTINNGRRRIGQLAASLRLGQHYIDSAHRLFLLAVQRNFVQGRKTSNVVAACLYIVCRREKSPHLLIDFSDVLQTNVYILGNCFLKFSRLLNLTLPIIDPSLYIHRFASKLEFLDKTHLVAMSALRLVSRMKRDWIQTGRRPAGICGAALLLAARTHGFHRTQKEVVEVVHICDETLRTRLHEFEMTPSGQLTIEEFETTELDNEADPPAFMRGRLETQRKEMLRIEGSAKVQIADNEALLGANVNSSYSSSEKRKRKRSQKLEDKEQTLTRLYNNIEQELLAAEDDRQSSSVNDLPVPSKCRELSLRNSTGGVQISQKDGQELSDVDDDDLNGMILTDSEVEKKTAIWMEMNKEYLKDQEQKASDNVNDAKSLSSNARSRRKKDASRQSAPADSAAEAAKNMLEQRRLSKKINYDALESHFSTGSTNKSKTRRSGNATHHQNKPRASQKTTRSFPLSLPGTQGHSSKKVPNSTTIENSEITRNDDEDCDEDYYDE